MQRLAGRSQMKQKDGSSNDGHNMWPIFVYLANVIGVTKHLLVPPACRRRNAGVRIWISVWDLWTEREEEKLAGACQYRTSGHHQLSQWLELSSVPHKLRHTVATLSLEREREFPRGERNLRSFAKSKFWIKLSLEHNILRFLSSSWGGTRSCRGDTFVCQQRHLLSNISEVLVCI